MSIFFALLINVFECYNCNFSPVHVHVHTYKKNHKLQSNFDEYTCINNINVQFSFFALQIVKKKYNSFTLYLLPTLTYEQLRVCITYVEET